jgi:hypothetical protein
MFQVGATGGEEEEEEDDDDDDDDDMSTKILAEISRRKKTA